MRILAGFCVSLAVLAAAATTALAADPYAYPGEPAPSYAPDYAAAPFAANWSGVYVGAQFGYGFGDIGDADFDGAFLGGTVGINGQVGPMLFGAEADGSWAPMEGAYRNRDYNMHAFGTIRGRVGYTFDRFVAYGTGGVAFASVEQAGVSSENRTYFGWALGAGIEMALTQNISAKLEYLYADLGEQDFRRPNHDIPVQLTTSLVRAGVNYRF
jgi:outer membrane immunogenic protein